MHTAIWKITRRAVPAGLIDDPVHAKVHNRLREIHLENVDEFVKAVRSSAPMQTWDRIPFDYSVFVPPLDILRRRDPIQPTKNVDREPITGNHGHATL